MTSILTSIKKQLGVNEDYTHFDTDIIIHINSTLLTLKQLGVDSNNDFIIIDSTQTWSDYIGDRKDLESIKTYIYLKVKLIFDPPTNSFTIDALERYIRELEWRINNYMEGGK